MANENGSTPDLSDFLKVMEHRDEKQDDESLWKKRNDLCHRLESIDEERFREFLERLPDGFYPRDPKRSAWAGIVKKGEDITNRTVRSTGFDKSFVAAIEVGQFETKVDLDYFVRGVCQMDGMESVEWLSRGVPELLYPEGKEAYVEERKKRMALIEAELEKVKQELAKIDAEAKSKKK